MLPREDVTGVDSGIYAGRCRYTPVTPPQGNLAIKRQTQANKNASPLNDVIFFLVHEHVLLLPGRLHNIFLIGVKKNMAIGLSCSSLCCLRDGFPASLGLTAPLAFPQRALQVDTTLFGRLKEKSLVSVTGRKGEFLNVYVVHVEVSGFHRRGDCSS